ncbi:uncharacterized protein LOC144017270 [Festucalex cinctus]
MQSPELKASSGEGAELHHSQKGALLGEPGSQQQSSRAPFPPPRAKDSSSRSSHCSYIPPTSRVTAELEPVPADFRRKANITKDLVTSQSQNTYTDSLPTPN